MKVLDVLLLLAFEGAGLGLDLKVSVVAILRTVVLFLRTAISDHLLKSGLLRTPAVLAERAFR
jgi:hypothetical protein